MNPKTAADILAIPTDRQTVKIWMDNRDMSLHCMAFGRVHDWTPRLQKSHEGRGSGRVCVHRLEPLPPTQLLCADWVSGLSWQPQVIVKNAPVIASRVGDVVTLAFDVIGPTADCIRELPPIAENRCSYRLYRMQWWDEDAPADNVLLGVQTVPLRNS